MFKRKTAYEIFYGLVGSEIYIRDRNNPNRVDELFRELEIIRPTDSEKDIKIVTTMFTDLIRLLSRPFNEGEFDFSDDTYFAEIYQKGEQISKDPEMSKLQARGSRHFIYFNRTFFGLYNILHALKAKVDCSKTDFLNIA